ncbi:reverse transcriptase domain-containing protein [Aeromonas dhakensis]|uniref:reverse transcriptase domain-containing protein n=1 Tax=Aeromonas dhakensis TaxID=196024 RepID=UPI003C6F0418
MTASSAAASFIPPAGGISRGCALSPLIGASLLWHIDADFAARGELYYARYMDDFIVLTRTRWRLRDAVRRLNGYLAADGFSQHPAKTWIGRLDRGIDWLGGLVYHCGTGRHRPQCPATLSNQIPAAL